MLTIYGHAAIVNGEAYNMNYVGVAMGGIYIVLIVRNLLFCSWIVSAILASYKKQLLMHSYRYRRDQSYSYLLNEHVESYCLQLITG